MLLKRRKPSSFGADGRRIGAPTLSSSSSSSTSSLGGTDAAAAAAAATATAGASAATSTTTTAIIRRPVGTGLVRRRPLPGSSSSSLSGSSMMVTNASTATATSSSTTSNNNLRKPVIGRPGTGIICRAPLMAGLTVSGIGSAGLLKPFQRPKTGRRAYKGGEDAALKQASLGPKRIAGGMERLLSRAGKGLNFKSLGRINTNNSSGDTDSSSDDDDDDKEEDRPFEPLCVWISPHQEGGEAKGLPGTV
jgi:hypothetical protein